MWTWKNWLGMAAVVLAVVLVSFIVEWHIRTGWQIFWLDGLIRWWAGFVMFGWVKDYQGFLAGILTFLGACTAVAAVMLQIRHSEKIANYDRHISHKSTLAKISMLWRSAYTDIGAGSVEKGRNTMAALAVTEYELARFSPGAARWSQMAGSAANMFLLSDEPIDHDMYDKAIIGVVAAQCFFDDIDRMIDSRGDYLHVPSLIGEFEDSLRSIGFATILDEHTADMIANYIE